MHYLGPYLAWLGVAAVGVVGRRLPADRPPEGRGLRAGAVWRPRTGRTRALHTGTLLRAHARDEPDHQVRGPDGHAPGWRCGLVRWSPESP